jgi:hypothetical protein
MTTSNSSILRDVLPAWLATVLAPAPAILVSKDGAAALMYFFVACAGLVAYSFRREASCDDITSQDGLGIWHRRMSGTAAALLAAWFVFGGLCVTLPPPHHLVAAWLGLMLLVPCLCVVPYLVLVTRQPFAAVVFAITLVACVKLAGCAIVVAVYGWDADKYGHTSMPWMRPNLLVWCFLAGTGILSAVFYLLGAHRWRHCGARGN